MSHTIRVNLWQIPDGDLEAHSIRREHLRFNHVYAWHADNVDPDIVQPLTELPSKFVTNAVEPEKAIAVGRENPVPAEAHPVNVDPDTVHAMTDCEP